MNNKKVYIIGGPNGTGKTTFVQKYLPEYAHVKNFVNADYIASGLSPFNSSVIAFKAGKMMLQLIEEYKKKKVSFGFESTLAGKNWLKLIDELKRLLNFCIFLFKMTNLRNFKNYFFLKKQWVRKNLIIQERYYQ